MISACGLGVGQVMFQENLWTGILFLFAILSFSRMAALYVLLGSFLPIPLAMLLGVEDHLINLGLMGYNGVLCAMALENTTWKSAGWATCSVILSVVFQFIGMNAGIPTLTAPFVLSVWLVLSLKQMCK